MVDEPDDPHSQPPSDPDPGSHSSNQREHASENRHPPEHRRAPRQRTHRRGRNRAGERKERVLHTRISEQLSDDIRQLADDLKVPTSNLVRNVLEEVFTMVESVSEDVGSLFEEVLDEAEGARDRIRRRANRSHRRHRRRDSYRSGEGRDEDGDDRRVRRRRSFDDVVETELRGDERRESHTGPGESGRVGTPEEGRVDPPTADASSSTARGEGTQEAAEPAVEHRAARDFSDVIGWQPLILNHDQSCANCGGDLPRGLEGFVGIGERGLTRTTLCRACVGMV
jgi:gas vesicle protein